VNIHPVLLPPFVLLAPAYHVAPPVAVLKLIGSRDRTIAAMIMQEALGLGVIGFFVGKFAATLWAPAFPKYVLLETGDAVRAFVLTLVVCALASLLAIRAALKIDPAEAIGG
jgi:putative ABC transport system permease protein